MRYSLALCLLVIATESERASAGGFEPTWPLVTYDFTPQSFGMSSSLHAASIHVKFRYGRAYFSSTDQTGPNGVPDGIVDTVDWLNAGNVPHGSSIRVSNANYANTAFAASPSLEAHQPNLWDGGVREFSISLVGSDFPITSTQPFFRMKTERLVQFEMTGWLLGVGGGSREINYQQFYGAPDSDFAFSRDPDLFVDVGVSTGQDTPRVDVSTWDNGAVGHSPIEVGAIPDVLRDNLRLTHDTPERLAIQFVGLGAQDVGVHVVPFSADYHFGSLTRSIRVIVVPEPTVCLAGLLLLRGRVRR